MTYRHINVMILLVTSLATVISVVLVDVVALVVFFGVVVGGL